MGGYPYDLPGAMPAPGVGGWNVPLESNLTDLRDRTRIHEGAYGVPLEAFTGGTDDERLQAAMAYASAQTRPPAIVLGNQSYTFNGGPYSFYPGLRIVGSLGHNEREFTTTGPHTVAYVGGSALFSVPIGGVRNMCFSGVQWRAATGTVNWQTPVADLSAGPQVQDATFLDSAWVGFATVMHARHTRVRIDRTYVNNGTDHQFKLGGSDNYYWQSGGFLSSTQMAASKYYVWFAHMSRSQVGPLYITPEKATGIRVDGSYGGLIFTGTLLDSTGRTATTACQGAAILITGGRGMVFRDLWFFNNAVNPSGAGRSPQDKGQVYIRGSAADLLFAGCQFGGGDVQTNLTPAGTPAIYAAIGVSNVKVVAPTAPAGGNKLMQHQSSGIITKYAADDWTLAVA